MLVKRLNVLIVDDSTFMRLTLKNIIEAAGHRVVEQAENGLIGVEKYKQYHPDVVTMDVTMPEMNGIEALKEIMNYDNEARVVICSAMGQDYLVIDAIRAGARDFIVKPFAEDRVREALRKAFAD